MNDPKFLDSPQLAPANLMVMRIIFGALLMGCLSFLGVALFLRMQQGKLFVGNFWAFDEPLVWIATGVGSLLIVLHWFVPTLAARAGFAAQTDQPKDELQLPRLYQTWFIIGQAMLEGAAFFGLVVFFLLGSGITLGIAILCILLMALRFPTQDAFESFVTSLSS